MSTEAGETALWQAVIRQAFADATSVPRHQLSDHDIQDAREWLTTPNTNFARVCDLAGKDPERVRRTATHYLAQHDRGLTAEFYEHDGERLTLSQWAKRTGIHRATLHRHIKAGWTIGRALSELLPASATVREDAVYLEHNGKRQTLAAWAKDLGISHPTLYARLMKGWTAEQVITTPLSGRRKPSNSGAGSDFAGERLTGPGSTAQDFPQTDFPQEDSAP